MQGAALHHWFFNFEPDADRAQAMWSNIYSHQMATFVGIQSGQPEIGNGPTTTPNATNAQMAGVGPNPDIPRQGVGVLGSQWFVNRPTRPYYFGAGNAFPYGQTGEGGLLLWGGLRILSTDVVPNDPHFGLVAYGGTVELSEDDHFVVVPQDGLQRRLNVVGQRFQAHLLTDRYTEARIQTDFRGVQFDIENVSGVAREGVIEITNLEPGAYAVYVDDVRMDGQVIVENNTDRNHLALPTTFTYTATEAATQTITIVNEPFAPVDTEVIFAVDGVEENLGTFTVTVGETLPAEVWQALEAADVSTTRANTQVADHGGNAGATVWSFHQFDGWRAAGVELDEETVITTGMIANGTLRAEATFATFWYGNATGSGGALTAADETAIRNHIMRIAQDDWFQYAAEFADGLPGVRMMDLALVQAFNLEAPVTLGRR